MTNETDARRIWGNLCDILEQGVETTPQLLVYQARRFRDQVLQRKKDFGIWQCYTWNDVVDRVKTFAMGLTSFGVKRGQTVAVVGENEPELFWSVYAAQAIGAKVVCLYPDLTAAQMEYLLRHAEAVMVICQDQEQVDKILDLEKKISEIHTIVYWDDRGMWKYDHPKLIRFDQIQEKGRAYLGKHPESFEEEVAAGEKGDIAALSYTSGTTGFPKGCVMKYEYIFDQAFRFAGAISFKPFTQYLSYLSPAWGSEYFMGMGLGLLVPFVVNFPEEPETVQDNIREIGTESLLLTPRQWESLASLVEAKMLDAGQIRRACYRFGMTVGHKVNLALLQRERVPFGWRMLYPLADRLVLRQLRDKLGLQAAYCVMSGGSGMSPDVFRFFHAMGARLRNTYGANEIGMVTIHQGETYDLETVGKLFPVHPRFGAPLEYRFTKEGELLVKGGSGFGGYYKDQEATSRKFDQGWLRTGDVLNVTDKDELVYLERLVDMRKLSTGHSYPPQFIENRLRFSPFVKDAMTVGDQDKPFVGALINIDAGILGRWAEQRAIGYTTFTDLSQNQKILELIKGEIEKVNSFLPDESRVKRFINLPKELDPDEDELTRSRKLRRGFLEQKYAQFISAIYSEKKEFEAEVPVKYQDGRIGVVNARVYVKDLRKEVDQRK
jgi:long-chain acyl-CoA synthetase